MCQAWGSRGIRMRSACGSRARSLWLLSRDWCFLTLREKDVLLNTRKTRKTGKRVALKGKYLLIKEDILKVVRDLEEETKKKKTKKGGRKTKYILISSEEEEEESVDELA